MQKILFSASVCLIFVAITAGKDLNCYQCEPVTLECEDVNASIVKCGDASRYRCSSQVMKNSRDTSKAIRKCVVPDNAGIVSCPSGFECSNCAEHLCNANPKISSTPKPDSASGIKAVWTTVAAVILAAVCL